MPDQIKSIARLIGNSYAHIQHGLDLGIEWGFRQMKQQEKTKKPLKTGTVGGKAAAVGRGVLGFLGSAGEAYYRTYNDLKKKGK